MAEDVIRTLPVTNDYVAIMEALEALRTNLAFRSPDGEPFSYRWSNYTNPLILRMWRDMGYKGESTDCSQWCAICLGWALKRSGRDTPADVESSQAFLSGWGTQVAVPISGDIVVFTDDAPKDAGHGHVTVFRSQLDANHIIGLGGNQDLKITSNCPKVPVSAINEERMPLDTRQYDVNNKAISGWHVAAYIRPPAPVRAPTKEPPPSRAVNGPQLLR
ncbi:hypothetical protein [Novosphingobium sp. FSW06-99]|uniref:hypothetical protein n=1 Tax=Novosphingobium sp. FSW06-99 TaxID=1739113 RepID=UPI0012E3F5A7|nr:hypothetical protein [Novosphingobium sp. FSW06-99]